MASKPLGGAHNVYSFQFRSTHAALYQLKNVILYQDMLSLYHVSNLEAERVYHKRMQRRLYIILYQMYRMYHITVSFHSF